MAQIIPSRFVSFVFDNPEEELNAKILNSLNVMHLHNVRTQLQELKLKLKIDVNKPLENLQNEASLTGQIEILDAILNDHLESLNKQNAIQQSQNKGA